MALNGKINGSGDIDTPPVIIVPELGPLRDRITLIKSIFIEKYDTEPEFYVRVPGR